MDKSLYVAMTGASSTLRAQGAVSQNLANVSTPGFRALLSHTETFKIEGHGLKSRYDAYAIGRNWGWLSVNDIRALEDMNPIDEGDVYLQPLNMTAAGMPPNNDVAPPGAA